MKNFIFTNQTNVETQCIASLQNRGNATTARTTFGGICNAVEQRRRISNSTQTQSGNTIAAQRGTTTPVPSGAEGKQSRPNCQLSIVN